MKKINWDNYSFCIRIAGNTYPRSLMVLHKKGYELRNWCVCSVDENNKETYEQDTYEALKDGKLFSALTPVELLGLVALWEARGDSWRNVSQEEWGFYENFEDESKIYDVDGNDITET